jgi:hypothetical protein
MKKFVLDEQTMMELWVAHRSAKKKRDADRIKAIYLLADGYTA